MGKLAVYEKQMLALPDQQISLADPDRRSMATSGQGSGVVGYNVQVAVDTDHHLIVAHEGTTSGSKRSTHRQRPLRLRAVIRDASERLRLKAKLNASAPNLGSRPRSSAFVLACDASFRCFVLCSVWGLRLRLLIRLPINRDFIEL
jgi:hypothetical protein